MAITELDMQLTIDIDTQRRHSRRVALDQFGRRMDTCTSPRPMRASPRCSTGRPSHGTDERARR